MTEAPVVPAEKLEQLGRFPTQTLIDALWVKQWPPAMIHGARPLFPGRKMAGRAVTLRFVPHRPDVAADKPKGEASPEYVAFELCGPHEVLVASSVGPWESIGGDIKFFRLFQRQVAGLVTDGSVRDSDEPPDLRLSRVLPLDDGQAGAGRALAVGRERGDRLRRHRRPPGRRRRRRRRRRRGRARARWWTRSSRSRPSGRPWSSVIKKELERHPGSPGRYYPFNEATWKLYEEYKRRGEA